MKRIFNYGNVIIIAFMMLTASCATTHQVLLGDVVSFGDDVRTSFHAKKNGKGKQTAPYTLFTPSNPYFGERQLYAMQSWIDNTEMENNTAGIFAMDLALDRVKYIRRNYLKHDLNAKYYIIYMTDGLDNISVQVAKNNKNKNYKTPEKYQKKMAKKIAKISRYKKKNKNQFDIYPVVFTDSDLGDAKESNNMSYERFNDFIDENMGWLRGSSRGPENAPEIIKAENFDIVLEKFTEEFAASGFEFHVPKGYEGKEIKMTFVGYVGQGRQKNEKPYKTELVGKLVRKGSKYYLEDVECLKGLKINNEVKKGRITIAAINNKSKKDELAIFRLEKPEFEDRRGEVHSYYIDRNYRYYDKKKDKEIEGVEQFVDNSGMWIKNSEYLSQAKGSIDTYFILVFDASTSLKEVEFANEREAAMEMISIITNSAVEAASNVDKLDKKKK